MSDLFFIVYFETNDMWGPCHHSMVFPWVVDGGDSLHIWRVAANILIEQLGDS
jgi:hypothetical protein